jgi:translation initiation factor IF-1
MTEETIEIEGTIVAVLAGTMFHVELDNKQRILAHISGRLRKRWIRLSLADRVRMEMSPYDLGKGRIIHRVR